MQKAFAVPLILACLSSPAAAQYESPDLTAGNVHVSRVVLLPVRAAIFRVNYKEKGTLMAPESEQAEKSLESIVSASLKSIGLTVDDTTFSPETLQGDKDLAAKVQAAEALFDPMSLEIEDEVWLHAKKANSQTRPMKGAFDGLRFPDGTDAVVIAFAQGYVSTKGKAFLNSAPGTFSSPNTGWDMRIGIIDLKNQEIEYIGFPTGARNVLLNEPEKTQPEIEKSFKKLMQLEVVSGSQKK
jgi:hypothetical protein